MAATNSVIYSIPPTDPKLKLKLVSLGIGKDKLLKIRMYFVHLGDSEKAITEYMNLNEQTLILPDTETTSHEVQASHVFASSQRRPVIGLARRKKQVVEFLFPLDKTEGDRFPYFQFKWKIHYLVNTKGQTEEKTEEQISRFDRVAPAHVQQGPGMYDPDYPADDMYLLPEGSEWLVPDFTFW